MTFTEMYQAIADAQEIARRHGQVVQKIARLCRRSLQESDVDNTTLDLLKKELQNWNRQTHTWKE